MKKSAVVIGILILLVIVFSSYFVFLKDKNQDYKINKEDFKSMIKVTSSSFSPGQKIPEIYTCDGQNINPQIFIDGLPNNTKSLVLIVDDPDAPIGTFTHWVVFNISPGTKEIKENSVPEGALLGKNDFGKLEYGGPCPPSGKHRYYFKVYALDTLLSLQQGARRKYVEKAMEEHIIDKGELMGTYIRK